MRKKRAEGTARRMTSFSCIGLLSAPMIVLHHSRPAAMTDEASRSRCDCGASRECASTWVKSLVSGDSQANDAYSLAST